MIWNHQASAVASRLALALGAAAFLAAALPAGARTWGVTRNFERTVATSAAPKVTIKGSAGDITIRSENRSDVQIHAVYHGQSDSDFDDMNLEVAPSSDGVNLHAIVGRTSDSIFSRAHHENRSIDLVVTVPTNASLDIDETAGDIRVEAPKGAVHAALRAGDITIDHVVGAVWAHVSAGDISLSLSPEWSGAAIDARASIGDINASAPDAVRARAKSIARFHVGIGDISGF